MSKKRKLLQVTMASALAASTAVTGLPMAHAAENVLKQQIPVVKDLGERTQVKIPSKLENPADVKEVVRIIVELDGAPAIQSATSKGLSYKDLSSSAKQQAESAVEQQQVSVQSAIQKTVGKFEVKESFTTIFNGFSLEVKAGDVKKLSLLPGIKAIYQAQEYKRPEVKPEMITSKELVQAQLAWEQENFRGEGTIVSVIDSGIDPKHRDFVLTDDASGDLTQEEVAQSLQNDGIEPGKYFSAKIPFGYNYMDDNLEVRDLGPDASMHGQHVSGTVGANGDEEAGGVKGVAPEAQILAMKVFGNDPDFPSTWGDVYVKAIDDSIKLGADVINMSLGSVAGYVDTNSPEQQAVGRAQDNGLLVSISAGNSDMYGADHPTWPINNANNQDYGLTGSPSVSQGSLGVASYENTDVQATVFGYKGTSGDLVDAQFLPSNDVEPPKGQEFEVEQAGLGKPADFVGKDFKGKYALISRGEISFVEKALEAQKAGAVGVLIYNNATGLSGMVSDPAITVPYMMIQKADGLAMKALLDNDETVKVSFNGKVAQFANPNAGKMSDFTSWGPTPNLDFKPEITAPGGQIYSTFNDNKYGLMSGTSMAAPHVAGGSALVVERVNTEFNLSGKERSLRVKNLLMNTSKPIELNEGEFVSPRRQGAGIMQLAEALSTPVVVTDPTTNEGKVALKEFNNNFSFTLQAENFSNQNVEYDVSVQLQIDSPINIGDGEFYTLPNDAEYGSLVLNEGEDYTITVPAKVVVPANSKADMTVDVELDPGVAETLDFLFENGNFVDGFVQFKDANGETDGNVPTLTVPFFGFNGSWDDASIFDANFWEYETFHGVQGLFTDKDLNTNSGKLFEDEDKYDATTLAFSPNGDGKKEDVLPIYTLRRNAKEMVVNVLDANGKTVRTLTSGKNLTKHYSSLNSYSVNLAAAWDGKINGKPAPAGQYQIELRAKVDYEGAEWQSVKYPVKIDVTAPTLEVKDVDQKDRTVSFDAMDDFSGVNFVEVWSGEKVIDVVLADAEGILGDYDFSEVEPGTELAFRAEDIAGNAVLAEEKVTVDFAPEEGLPVVMLETPEAFEILNESEVTFKGTVTDDSKVTGVTVEGEEVDSFDGSKYSHVKTLEDGFHRVKVEATDQFGNKANISRPVFVDTTAPGVVVSDVPGKVGLDQESVDLNITVSDNFDYARVFVNDNEIFFQDISEPYGLVNFEKTLVETVALEEGVNTFEVKMVDLAGNETVETVTVNRTDAASSVIELSDIQSQLDPAGGSSVTVEVDEEALAEAGGVEFTLEALIALADSDKELHVYFGDNTMVLSPEHLADLAEGLSEDAETFVIYLTNENAIEPGSVLSSVQVTDTWSVGLGYSSEDEYYELDFTNYDIHLGLALTKEVMDFNRTAAFKVDDKQFKYVGSKFDDGKVFFKINELGTYAAYQNDVTFSDIPDNYWAQDSIEILASNMIIKGKTETTFAPKQDITRAEFAVLIARALNLPTYEYEGVFTDVPESKSWMAGSIEAAYAAGIVKGRTATTFDPNGKISRQDMATMIIRALDYENEQYVDMVEEDADHVFADQKNISNYALKNVQLAYELEIINGRGGNLFAPKAEATRAEAAKMLYQMLLVTGELEEYN